MSFVNAGREIQRFIIDKKYMTPQQEMINALLSARTLNTTIKEENSDFLFGPGKLRQLKISYYPIQCDVLDDSLNANICATGTKAEPKQEWFSIADFTKSKNQTLSVDDIRLVDGDWNVSDHAKAQVNATLGALRRGLSIAMSEKVIAHKGLHLDGSEFGNRVTMSNTSSGLQTPLGYFSIQKEQNDGGFANFFTVGHTEVWNWKKFYGIADVNTTLGQNFKQAGIDKLYYDVNLNTIMGVTAGNPEYILTFDPEALKFVSYSRNTGIFATDYRGLDDLDRAYASGGRDVIKGSFLDPMTGILWDFYAKFNPCPDSGAVDGEWTWWLQLEWDIVFPTIQACNVQGVNGIMMYKTCPVVIPTCPTGDTPSPAPVAHEYDWTPGSIFGSGGLYIATLTIGGVSTQPNVLVTNITELTQALNDNYLGAAVFAVDGSDISYTGYSAITGSINGAIAITFAI